MSKKIYTGNLSFATTEDTLRTIFSDFGEVVSVTVITDKETQKSKGFGFVEMAEDSAADRAISSLNQKEVDGRRIRVSAAEEKPSRKPFRR